MNKRQQIIETDDEILETELGLIAGGRIIVGCPEGAMTATMNDPV